MTSKQKNSSVDKGLATIWGLLALSLVIALIVMIRSRRVSEEHIQNSIARDQIRERIAKALSEPSTWITSAAKWAQSAPDFYQCIPVAYRAAAETTNATILPDRCRSADFLDLAVFTESKNPNALPLLGTEHVPSCLGADGEPLAVAAPDSRCVAVASSSVAFICDQGLTACETAKQMYLKYDLKFRSGEQLTESAVLEPGREL